MDANQFPQPLSRTILVNALMQQVVREHQQSLLLLGQAWEDNLRIAQLTEQLQELLTTQPAAPPLPQPVAVQPDPQPDDPKAIRTAKILKYKEKVKRRREKVAVTRQCPGRKVAAQHRSRVQGKFAKMA